MSQLTEEQLFETLLTLLNTSTPFGKEKLIINLLPKGGNVDEVGNYWYCIGESETLFCCHLDTADSKPTNVEPFYYEGNIYTMSNESECLGGDDRCGILILIALINAGIPGTYLFHIGEEKGCIGAKHIATKKDLSNFKRAIEFDRRGKSSIISVMLGDYRTCSVDFVNALAKQLDLGFQEDIGGIYTDVVNYANKIPEVTNLSCGYYNEHSNQEFIEADWLIKTYIPKLYNVDWENLPIIRDHNKSNIEANNDFIFHSFQNEPNLNKIFFKCDYCQRVTENICEHYTNKKIYNLCEECFNFEIYFEQGIW